VIELAEGLLGLAALSAQRAVREARRASALGPFERSPMVGRRPSIAGHSVTGRAIAVTAACGVVAWLVAGPVGVGVGALLLSVAPAVGRRVAARRASALLAQQLIDAVGALAAAARAGRSVAQAICSAAEEVGEPLASTLRTLGDALAAGDPFDDAVRRWAGSVGSDDAALVAATLSLHRRMGGDVAAGVDLVGVTLHDRAEVTAEVRSMTAQARLSGLIVGSLPIAFLAVLWLVSREDVVRGLSHPAGRVAVVIGLLLEAGAYVWIRRLLEVR
jgi:tight adherence protein B